MASLYGNGRSETNENESTRQEQVQNCRTQENGAKRRWKHYLSASRRSIADAFLGKGNWLAKLIIVAAVVFALALIGISAPGRKVIGIASVIDGDTIEIHGRRIRLFGIDAPESEGNGTPYERPL